MKTETIKFGDFMNGNYKKAGVKEGVETVGKVIGVAAPILISTLPKGVAAAAIDGAFGNIHDGIMVAFDYGVVLVIIFSGAAWGLGHRSKAIEILIGVCCGYILARHAVDIRDALKKI